MSFPRRRLNFALLALGALLLAGSAHAVMNPEEPIHYSADREVWDRKHNRLELIGHAAVNQPGESLTSDYALLDMNARTIDAKGNCVYLAPEVIMYGEEMIFSLDTHTGLIKNGRVSNDRFTLAGENIHRLGQGRFQTHEGEYSTCHDCPQSWTIHAQDVDMQMEGYAWMKNVTAKVKDAPVAWSPYLVVPMKTRRQTGILFPRFGLSSRDGFVFVLPFFWAISRSADMTIGAGSWAKRGRRVEWEGRYALTGRSQGIADFYYLHDELFPLKRNRWALDSAITQELPWNTEAKLQLIDASDNDYPRSVGDIPGMYEPVLTSDLILSHATPQVSTYVAAKRYRNLLQYSTDIMDPKNAEFDERTVQVFPEAVMTTNDKFLFEGPVAAGITLGVANFTRSLGPFDYHDPSAPAGTPVVPGVDPIRKATRVAITPSLYTTFRPWDVVSVVPSLQYRSYSYSFHNDLPSLQRGYLLFQTDLSTQLEKIWDTDNKDAPREKNLIRPLLKYSIIPPFAINDHPDHPFVKQIQTPGFNFDDSDIIPRDESTSASDYFAPLGHSISYGLTTQWIKRLGALDVATPSYLNFLEFDAGQTYNLRELHKPPSDRRPFSRFFAQANTNFSSFTSSTQYFYYPYADAQIGRSDFTTTLTYILDRSYHQDILLFDRSLSLSYSRQRVSAMASSLTGSFSYSLSDYILPTGAVTYDFLNSHLIGANASLTFQGPSRCWKFTLGLLTSQDPSGKLQVGSTVDMALNLTGTGFGGVSEVTNEAMSR